MRIRHCRICRGNIMWRVEVDGGIEADAMRTRIMMYIASGAAAI